MSLKQTIVSLCFALAATAKPLATRYAQNSTSTAIQWGSCDFEGKLPVLCGSLQVPLDYTQPGSNETVSLDLVKVAATESPSRGSILFNFGGPGYEGRHELAGIADYLQYATGGYHDLIAFDPRGTTKALAYSCFASSAERTLATVAYPLPPGDSSDIALGQLWADSTVWSNICRNNTQDVGSLIGTAFVARDMMQIVDALGEDGLLRYWGISYGSVLGETVAALFPDRMDRILLDGIVNGHNYYHKSGLDVDQLLSADAAFTETLSQCIAAGDKCALSTVNSTAIELQATLVNLAEELRLAPIAVNTTVIDYTFIINVYYYGIKYGGFQALAPLILDILTRQNLEAIVEYYQQVSQSVVATNPDSLIGIVGADTIPRYNELAGELPDLEYVAQTSSLFWGLDASFGTLTSQWPFHAKEIYDGDFNVKTRNPILFVGNTWDPATSIASARNMSASFEGSVVFEQRSIGHSTLTSVSTCTAGVIRDYFVNGKLPSPNTICDVDTPLFK